MRDLITFAHTLWWGCSTSEVVVKVVVFFAVVLSPIVYALAQVL